MFKPFNRCAQFKPFKLFKPKPKRSAVKGRIIFVSAIQVTDLDLLRDQWI